MLRFAFSGFAMAVLSGSAAAEPLDAAAFERLARGRTLHFTLDGLPFGSEQFFDGRRSLWRFADGECGSGGWWDQGGLICFAYDGGAEASCWSVADDGGQVRAELVRDGAATGFVLELERRDTAPLPCPGPATGS